MTEEEIEANALSDLDNPLMTPEQFANGWRADTPRRIRAGLGLTQERFADRFGIPLGTLRDWEQFASYPDHAARTLLRVIERHPDAVADAVAAHKQHVADLLAQLREPAPTAR